jgi:hypothetical protein
MMPHDLPKAPSVTDAKTADKHVNAPVWHTTRLIRRNAAKQYLSPSNATHVRKSA